MVALVWQDFVARCYPSMLRPAGRWTLGLTVWAIYLADRLIDVRQPATEGESSRHRFYRRHRLLSGGLLAAAIIADVSIAIYWLRPVVLSTGLIVAASVVSYLGLFALLRIGREWSKRFCAAILFTAGVFLVAWTSTAHAILIGPAAAFCLLCLYNLVLVDDVQRRQFTRYRALWILPLIWLAAWWFGGAQWYTAVALSVTGLAVLDLTSRSLSEDARRVLADAVLLTPLLL